MIPTVENESEKVLEKLVEENEQELVEAWHDGIKSQDTEDIVVFLIRNGDSINIGTGPRKEFIEQVELIKEFTDIEYPAPQSEIPYVKNFWAVAVDTKSGDNCLWLMSTFLINSFGGTS